MPSFKLGDYEVKYERVGKRIVSLRDLANNSLITLSTNNYSSSETVQ